MKLHTMATPVRIHKVLKVIDASEVDGQLGKDHVGRHDVADLVLETRNPVAFDLIGSYARLTDRGRRRCSSIQNPASVSQMEAAR